MEKRRSGKLKGRRKAKEMRRPMMMRTEETRMRRRISRISPGDDLASQRSPRKVEGRRIQQEQRRPIKQKRRMRRKDRGEVKKRTKIADQMEDKDESEDDKPDQQEEEAEEAAPEKKKARISASQSSKKRVLKSETGGSSPAPSRKGKKAKAAMKEDGVKDPQPEASTKRSARKAAKKEAKAAEKEDRKQEDEAGTGEPAEVEKPKKAQCFARRYCPKGDYQKAKWISLRKCFEELVKPYLTTYSKHEDMLAYRADGQTTKINMLTEIKT